MSDLQPRYQLVEEPMTRRAVWWWWERRRLRYNRDVFLVGIVSWALVAYLAGWATPPEEEVHKVMAVIFGPPLYGLLANVVYTAGPLADVVLFRGRPRVGLHCWICRVVLVVTALPGVWALVGWLLASAGGKK